MFSRDTNKVLVIIKDLTVDTDAEKLFKVKRCGWEAMLALQNHYDGKSENKLREQVAKFNIKKLFYRN